MSGSNWRAGVAIGVIFLGFGTISYWMGSTNNYCLPEEQAGIDNNANTSNKSDDDGGDVEDFPLPARINYSVTADGQKWVRCTENEERQSWLEPSEWASIASAVFAAFLTLATYGLWVATNKLFETSRKQAEAATNSGRAFLTPTTPYILGQVGYKRYSTAPKEWTYFNARIENRGLGQGFLHYWAIAHEVVRHTPKGDKAPRPSDSIGRIMIDNNGSWGSDEYALSLIKLTANEVDDIRTQKRWLHIYGYIRYSDLISGTVRESGFHYSYLPKYRGLIIERDETFLFDRIVPEEKRIAPKSPN